MQARTDRRQSGAAMIEFALGSVVFFIALLGVMDWAWVFFQHQTLMWRASDAARLAAATRIDNPTEVQNMVYCGSRTCSGSPSIFFEGANVNIQHTSSLDKVDDITVVRRYYARVAVENYTFRHFTPFLAGRFTGRPIVAAQPMECLEEHGDCWVD